MTSDASNGSLNTRYCWISSQTFAHCIVPVTHQRDQRVKTIPTHWPMCLPPNLIRENICKPRGNIP